MDRINWPCERGESRSVATAARILEPGAGKGGCDQTYYKWQQRLFEMAQAQQRVQFAEVTPVQPVHYGNVVVAVRIAGAEANIHSEVDATTVETVLRILKSG